MRGDVTASLDRSGNINGRYASLAFRITDHSLASLRVRNDFLFQLGITTPLFCLSISLIMSFNYPSLICYLEVAGIMDASIRMQNKNILLGIIE